MRRFLGLIVFVLLLVLGYAFVERQQQTSRAADATADDRLVLVCTAYENVRTSAPIQSLPKHDRALHQAADSVCDGDTVESPQEEVEPEVR